jgi:hypothetical protein
LRTGPYPRREESWRKPFGGFEFEKLRRERIFKNVDKSQAYRLHSRKRPRSSILGKSSKLWKKECEIKGENNCCWIRK